VVSPSSAGVNHQERILARVIRGLPIDVPVIAGELFRRGVADNLSAKCAVALVLNDERRVVLIDLPRGIRIGSRDSSRRCECRS
jgi:hypothetical protein